MRIERLIFLIRLNDHVDENPAPGPVERNRVLNVSLAQHIAGRDAGHLFDGAVPRDHVPGLVDGKRGIRKKIDDIGKTPLGVMERAFCLSCPYRLTNFVRKLGKLGLRVAAFLEIEVRTVVDRLDHDLLASPAGKKDKRDVPEPLPDRF